MFQHSNSDKKCMEDLQKLEEDSRIDEYVS